MGHACGVKPGDHASARRGHAIRDAARLELERELNRVPLDAPLLKGRQHLQYPHRDFASLAASASRSSGLGQLLKKL